MCENDPAVGASRALAVERSRQGGCLLHLPRLYERHKVALQYLPLEDPCYPVLCMGITLLRLTYSLFLVFPSLAFSTSFQTIPQLSSTARPFQQNSAALESHIPLQRFFYPCITGASCKNPQILFTVYLPKGRACKLNNIEVYKDISITSTRGVKLLPRHIL